MRYDETFQQKLDAAVAKNNSFLCVGLDSDVKKIPKHLEGEKYPQFVFNKAIIDATHDLVCAYKPNSAFYEARGASGIEELKMTCDYINNSYTDIPIILDVKRGDIGSSNEGYIAYAFDYLCVDAITLHPYLGYEALKPFIDRKEKGCIILCKTSNPGSREFQDIVSDGKPLYQIIAEKVAKDWNINSNCMLVVGATYPKELAIVRRTVGDMTLLVPGIGSQEGETEKVVKIGLNSKGAGMIINASRSIIFVSAGVDFAQKAREEAAQLRQAMNAFRF